MSRSVGLHKTEKTLLFIVTQSDKQINCCWQRRSHVQNNIASRSSHFSVN